MKDNNKCEDYGKILTAQFDEILNKNYKSAIAPPSRITGFGIRTLDALLGGGLASNMPVQLSSTPETGKSTLAFQFAKQFQEKHKNSVVVYLDIEGSSNAIEDNTELESRISIFNIDTSRFMYKPMQLDTVQVFKLFDEFNTLKAQLEKETKKEVEALFIWDSVSSTPSSKDASEPDVHKLIGYKAKELSHNLNRLKAPVAFGRWTFLVIDQVRANFKIDPYARTDKSVGNFGNYKSATNVVQLHHNLQQWLYLAKGDALKITDPLGIDGWVLKIHVEKNKFAPSQLGIDVLFDKKYGVLPLQSEYYFMQNLSDYERKLFKKIGDIPPMHVHTVRRSRVIQVYDDQTGDVIKESKVFQEKNLVAEYNTDPEFKAIFDEALEQAIELRIRKVLFRKKNNKNIDIDINNELDEDEINTIDIVNDFISTSE